MITFSYNLLQSRIYELRDLAVSAASRDVSTVKTTATAGRRTVWNLVLWVDNLYLLCVWRLHSQNVLSKCLKSFASDRYLVWLKATVTD